jgi:hypothetical protein
VKRRYGDDEGRIDLRAVSDELQSLEIEHSQA